MPVDGSNGEYAKAAIIRLCYSLLLKAAQKNDSYCQIDGKE